MNNVFNEAIESHAQWKLILKKHIEEGVEQNIADVGNCHICGLGRWIYGDGAKYNRLPSYNTMCVAHEQFHRAAAEVVFNANAKNIEKAKSLLSFDGEFNQSSVKLDKAIMDCKQNLADSLIKGIRNVRKVKDIVNAKENKNVFSIDCDAPVKEAIKMMLEHNIGSIVVNKDGGFLGLITERGSLKNIMHKGIAALESPVSEMLDNEMIQVDPTDLIEQCMMLMTAAHMRHLPVIENGKLLGIISIGDLVKEVINDDNEQISQLDSYVHNDYGFRG